MCTGIQVYCIYIHKHYLLLLVTSFVVFIPFPVMVAMPTCTAGPGIHGNPVLCNPGHPVRDPLVASVLCYTSLYKYIYTHCIIVDMSVCVIR